jgi:hypothetical protein
VYLSCPWVYFKGQKNIYFIFGNIFLNFFRKPQACFCRRHHSGNHKIVSRAPNADIESDVHVVRHSCRVPHRIRSLCERLPSSGCSSSSLFDCHAFAVSFVMTRVVMSSCSSQSTSRVHITTARRFPPKQQPAYCLSVVHEILWIIALSGCLCVSPRLTKGEDEVLI